MSLLTPAPQLRRAPRQSRALVSLTRWLAQHRAGRATAALLAAGLTLALIAPAAQAHGPVAPLASSYLAKIESTPAGLNAKVVDGDLRLWLSVPKALTVVVLDYRLAPYLRFSAAGVAVNTNSEMYYLNQTPIAEVPPAGLTRSTPPHWQSVTSGHSYEWHDGRLHALATVALTPGTSFVGRWKVPLLVGGRPGGVTGSLWHADAPSIVWFWPIVVLLLCLIAAQRLRRRELDARLGRVLAVAGLAAIAVASIGRQLHGRPDVSVFSMVELAVILALVAWGLERELRGRAGFLTAFAIAFAALWEGITLLTTLLDGYVLMAVPPFLARAATVLCLGCGIGLVLLLLTPTPEREDALTPRRAASDALPGDQGGVARSLAQ